MASKTTEKYGKKVDLKGELQYVRLGQMKVSSLAQRERRQHRVDHLLSIFDPEKMGIPRLSKRDGHYFIVDGQHRTDALKEWLGKGWEDVAIECWVVEGLTESQEAEYFLSLNDVLTVSTYEKFMKGVTANRNTEIEITSIVDSLNLRIGKEETAGTIAAVGSLLKSFKRDGSEDLRKSLVIAKNAFGDPGLKGAIIDALGLMCHRYNGRLDEKTVIDLLSKVNGGVGGLLNQGRGLRSKTGQSLNQCIAAAAVKIINRGLTGKDKLADWFKEI
jgi:hypothetical protein